MFVRGEIYEGYEQHVLSFSQEPECTPSEAMECILKFRSQLPDKTPTHYNRIVINPRIDLWLPGKLDKEYKGDYLLTWDGEPPKHSDVGWALINIVNSIDEPKRAVYLTWMKLLEDAYENGTKNISSYTDEKQRFALQLLFWLTLQEDINKPYQMGKLRPFCRYAEALSTTQEGFGHTYEEVQQRMYDYCSKPLDEWELPYVPSFYHWSENECAW